MAPDSVHQPNSLAQPVPSRNHPSPAGRASDSIQSISNNDSPQRKRRRQTGDLGANGERGPLGGRPSAP